MIPEAAWKYLSQTCEGSSSPNVTRSQLLTVSEHDLLEDNGDRCSLEIRRINVPASVRKVQSRKSEASPYVARLWPPINRILRLPLSLWAFLPGWLTTQQRIAGVGRRVGAGESATRVPPLAKGL